MKERICVIGLGYMGLPLAALMARAGFSVVGVDLKRERVEAVNRGACPFDEPGLAALIKAAVDQKSLSGQTDIPDADVYIVSVPTPERDHRCDLSAVTAACESLARRVRDGVLVVIESTVRPGTCQDVVRPIFEAAGKNVQIAHCPERAIPGNTLYELVHNDRVIGGLDAEAWARTKAVYSAFIKGRIHVTDVRTAECVKLMENTFRDVNIALANEFSRILEEQGVDPWTAIELANKHPRVNILNPGPGVGGHCIAVDPWFLAEGTENARLIRTARAVNDARPLYIAEKAKAWAERYGTKIAVLGVAYKKNVDDSRETPALPLVRALEAGGFEVTCSDPFVKEWAYPLFPLDAVLDWCDFAILVTDHDVYRGMTLRKPCLDTRNALGGGRDHRPGTAT